MSEADRRARGLETYSAQFGIDVSEVEEYFVSTFGASFGEEAFQATGGAAWNGGALELKHRSLIVIGILAALGGVDARLRGHVTWALANGATAEEIDTVMLLVANYAGFARASVAQEIARDAISAARNNGQ